MGSRLLHVLNTAWLLFPKRFFLLPSLSLNHHRKIIEEQTNSPLKVVFFNRSFMGNCLWGAAGAFFLYFLVPFPVIFHHIHPPKKILPLLPPVCQEHQNISSPPSASSPDLEAGQEINFPQTILLVQSLNPLASLPCAESHTAERPPPSDLFITNH